MVMFHRHKWSMWKTLNVPYRSPYGEWIEVKQFKMCSKCGLKKIKDLLV